MVEEGDARVFMEPIAAAALEDKILDAERQADGVRFMLSEQEPPTPVAG